MAFVAGIHPGRPEDALIVKPHELVQRYLDLLAEEAPRVIVELGTKEGGSAALMLVVGRPDRILTIDLAPEVPPVLQRLAATDGTGGATLVAFTGIDQADTGALRAVVDRGCGGQPIDLVVDDASHRLAPTRASFDVLFPRVRPGGTYIIEDWASEAVVAARLGRSVTPSHPDFAERLDLIRSLVLRLNDPGYRPPAEVVSGLASAWERGSDGSAPDESFLLGLLVDVAARVDLDVLRPVLLPDLDRPLVDMVVELSMVAATRADVVAHVEATGEWIKVRRGPADLPLDGFRLADQWADHFAFLGRAS